MGKKLFFQFILSVLVASLSYAQTADKLFVEDTKKVYQLTGKWNFNKTDNITYASLGFDDSGWELISVPGQWHLLGKKDIETAWYRRSVDIKEDFFNTPISILVPVIADAHEFYFNGTKIGGVGKISPSGKILIRSNLPGVYTIPSNIINYGGNNLIAVRISDNVGWGGFVTPNFFIGSGKILKRKFQRKIMWNASISFLLVFLGIYYLILFLCRLKEKIYFYYALFTIVAGSTLFGSAGLAYLVIDNFWFSHFIFHTGLNILTVFGLLFIYSYFEYERDLIFKIFITFYCLLFSVFLLTPLHLSIFRFYGNVTLTISIVLMVAAMAWVVFLIIKAVRLKKMGGNIIGIGGFFCMLALANDLLSYLGVIHTRRLMAEGFTIASISISLDMALRYTKLYDALQDAQEELIEKEKIDHEIKLAAEVQKSLLPQVLPQNNRFGVDAFLEPARMVGGDFYDVIKIDDEHFGILVGDVADKGMQAAIFMAVTRTLFYCEIPNSLSPAQVAKAVHKHITSEMSRNDIFVTAFYGILHCPTGQLTYIRAGHEPPLLYRPGQPVDTIMSEGRFLGMVEDLDLREYTIKLESGDRLILYSDGIPEATNLTGDPFGKKRFKECLKENGYLAAPELVRQILKTTKIWTQGTNPFDDLTLLVVEAK